MDKPVPTRPISVLAGAATFQENIAIFTSILITLSSQGSIQMNIVQGHSHGWDGSSAYLGFNSALSNRHDKFGWNQNLFSWKYQRHFPTVGIS